MLGSESGQAGEGMGGYEPAPPRGQRRYRGSQRRQTGLRPPASRAPARSGGRARRQHGQPVEAQGRAARLRHDAQGVEEILVDGVALAVDAVLLGPSRPRSGGAVRSGRSARRRRWPARPRRRRARTVPPRGDRGAEPRQGGLGRRDTRRGWSRVRSRGWDSTFSTITLLKMSAQVSSAATRTPESPLAAYARASRSVSPSAWMVARRSSPA